MPARTTAGAPWGEGVFSVLAAGESAVSQMRIVIAVADDVSKETTFVVAHCDVQTPVGPDACKPHLLKMLRDMLSVEPQSPDDPLVVIAAGRDSDGDESLWSLALEQFPGLVIYDVRELLAPEPGAPAWHEPPVARAHPPVTWKYWQQIERRPVTGSLQGLLMELCRLGRRAPSGD